LNKLFEAERRTFAQQFATMRADMDARFREQETRIAAREAVSEGRVTAISGRVDTVQNDMQGNLDRVVSPVQREQQALRAETVRLERAQVGLTAEMRQETAARIAGDNVQPIIDAAALRVTGAFQAADAGLEARIITRVNAIENRLIPIETDRAIAVENAKKAAVNAQIQAELSRMVQGIFRN